MGSSNPNTYTIPPASTTAYVAAFKSAYPGLDGLRGAYGWDQLEIVRNQHPDWSGDQWRQYVNQQWALWDKQIQGQLDPFTAGWTTVLGMVGKLIDANGGEGKGAVVDSFLGQLKETLLDPYLTGQKFGNQQDFIADAINHLGPTGEGVVGTGYTDCKTDAKCLAVAAKLFPGVVMAPPGKDPSPDDLTAGQIVQNNPTVFNNTTTNTTTTITIKDDNSVEIKVDELSDQLNQGFVDLRSTIKDNFDNVMGSISDLDDQMHDMEAWINNQQEQAKWQAKAEQDAADYGAIFDAASADLNALVAIAGLFDPKVAKGLAVVGGAILSIAQTSVKAMQQIANFASIGDKAGEAFASAAMTGNVISAVMSVLTLLMSSDQEDPEQMILDGINHLQQQITDLGEHMDARFDRIDRTLSTIYDAMVTSFTQINIQLGHVQGDLNNIQNNLRDQAAELQRIEAAVGTYAVVVARRDLLDAMATALGWNARNNAAMTSPQFLGFFDKFRAWGVVNADDDAETGGVGRNTTPDHYADELSSVGLDRNLIYLDAATRQIGAGPLFSNGSTAANPLTWSMAARASAQLVAEQAALALNLPKTRFNDLRNVGNQILDCQLSVCTDKKTGKPRTDFFHALVDYYRSTMSKCGAAMDAAAATVLNEKSNLLGWDQETPMPNLWGAADQAFSFRPASSINNTFAVPDSVMNFFPPQVLLATWFDGQDKNHDTTYAKRPQITVWGSWEVVERPPHGGGKETDAVNWKMAANMRLTYNGVELAKWGPSTFGSQFTTNGPVPTTAKTPQQLVIEGWTTGQNFQQKALAGLVRTADYDKSATGAQPSVETQLAELKGDAQNAARDVLAGQVEVIEGARQVLGNVVAVGMPRTINNDDVLRTLLQAEPPLASAPPPAPKQGGGNSGGQAPPPMTPPLGNGIPSINALSVWWGLDDTSTAPLPNHYEPLLVSLAASKAKLLSDRIDAHLDNITERAADTFPTVSDGLTLLGMADKYLNNFSKMGPLMPTTLPTLRQGAHGPDVKRLQALLLVNIPGLTPAKMPLNGKFTAATTKQVKKYQSLMGLANKAGPSGEVDGATWRCLLGLD